jgi:predicted alpha/beta-fold hydrolase
LNFHHSDRAVIDRQSKAHHSVPSFVLRNQSSEYTYRPAWWVPGGHAQTLWGKFFRPRPPLPVHVQRWETPDGDFIDVCRLSAAPGRPRLLFLHGLEGTIRSHYVSGFFSEALRREWAADLLIFRGCGDEPNRLPRFYHSGETGDLAFALGRLIDEDPGIPIMLAGVSLGGNVVLKFLGEQGANLPRAVRGAATISVPYDLERGARHLSHGFSRIYDRHFLKSLRRKARAKLARFPGLFDAGALERAATIYEFDDAVTAPVHGFVDAHDYYARSSSVHWLRKIARPALLLSSYDDPFLPPAVLDAVRAQADENVNLTLEFTRRGGHVGFVAGQIPFRPSFYAERRVCDFLATTL